ncbi:glycosyltransferase family 90 protein [Annulohypoxylon maeteangense]|uniref:glycosyltransferase family 90 protein n=1 Tax=Annulohypoxylon maeteangense TaxID=1927788 RepID=UPI0020086635|nr:glycosyltransferase family 90 protein [Annulohypoxylon maeteangense]KAI0880302.1 glycosyltransferase family 90 protein [Annulohypoxylon maeteangense]
MPYKMAHHQQRLVVLAVCILSSSTAFIWSRYYKSAAFERPFHFSILTLLFSGLTLFFYAKYILRSEPGYAPLSNGTGNTSAKSFFVDILRYPLRLRSQYPSFALLLLCVVARTILYWRTIRTIHCSWDGLQAFLPFLLIVYDIAELRPINLPRHEHDTHGRTTSSSSTLVKYGLIALFWGLAATDTLLLSERTTGAICPAATYIERLIPLAQLLMLALDGVFISQVGKLRQANEGQANTWHFLGTLFLTSAGVLTFFAVWSSIDRANFQWNVFLSWLATGDLIVDSIVVTIGITSTIYLLGYFHPLFVSLLLTATSIFVYLQWRIMDGTMIRVWSNWWGLITGVWLFVGAGLLLHFGKTANFQLHTSSEGAISRNRYGFCALVTFLLVFAQTIFVSSGGFRPTPTPIIANARSESDAWIAGAGKSKSLQEAVSEYRKRYGIPPPPNFDKWYHFAASVKSPIIDTFDQIHADLLPYWGTLPSVLRQRTTHLLEHPSLSMGGIILEGGKADVSPHILGTHRWMMDVTKDMLEPFAQWLPDMQLAFNLDDECRISIPLDRMKAYTEEGLKARARLGEKQELSHFSDTQEPPWVKGYLNSDEKIWDEKSPWFLDRSKRQIFYEWISPTCPAESPVNKYRWWNKKAECLGCSAPHMTHGFVSNWTLSGDLCHQPDLAYLHGVLLSPSAMAPSHTLFPVFSQSRLYNFADILYPSPWNFGEKVEIENNKSIPWDQKLNSVYWRGASSDGYAVHGAWQTFLRARFVNMAAKAKLSIRAKSLFNLVHYRRDIISPLLSASTPSPSAQPTAPTEDHIVVNASFVGKFDRCDDRDCTAEHVTFYGSPTAEPPPSLDFQEHWHHRHLIDLDGAAFSGRFIPFLKSGSLPYRAALFRTWWEERVHAWRHFVPLDVRLSDLWDAVNYLGGPGLSEADEIAQAGRDWALQSLRKEDMQVYMFRLLLEWGRLVDDHREDLGFAL